MVQFGIVRQVLERKVSEIASGSSMKEKVGLTEFRTLGVRIAERLEGALNIDLDLVDVAYEELSNFSFAKDLDASDLFDIVFAPDAPRQFNSPFSDFPVVVFMHRDFYIELLVWFVSTTTIHQHSFSGAFRVLQGGSLHTTFRYAEIERIDSDVKLGNLKFQDSEVLAPGAVRRITPGESGLIHSLFHLRSPSITLVVRSHGNYSHGPQFNYFPPGIALNEIGLAKDDHIRCVRRALEIAEKLKVGGGIDLVSGHAGRTSAGRWAYLSMRLLDRYPAARVIELQSSVAGRYSEDFRGYLTGALTKASEVLRTVKARQSVSSHDLRFFLALLMNVPSRDRILRLISECYPTYQPADLCATWIIALAREKDDLRIRMIHAAASVGGESRLLGAHIGNAIGINRFDEIALKEFLGVLIANDQLAFGCSNDETLRGLRSRLQEVPELSVLVR